jgi:hypothetical protein
MTAYTMTSEGGVTRYFIDGVETPKAAALAAWRADPVNAEKVNRDAVLAKIDAAIQANAAVEASMDAIISGVNTFAAIGAPTTAQRNAFVANLGQAVKTIAQDQQKQARQLTALARHAAGDFTSTDGA